MQNHSWLPKKIKCEHAIVIITSFLKPYTHFWYYFSIATWKRSMLHHFPFYFSLFIHLKVLLQISYRSTNYLYRNRDFHFTSILDLDLLMAVLKAREFKICFLKSKCYVNSSWKVARKGRKGKLKVSVQTGFLCILHFTTMCQSYRI